MESFNGGEQLRRLLIFFFFNYFLFLVIIEILIGEQTIQTVMSLCSNTALLMNMR